MEFWFSKDPSISIPLVSYIGWFEERLQDEGWVKYDVKLVYDKDLILVAFNYDKNVRWICPPNLISEYEVLVNATKEQFSDLDTLGTKVRRNFDNVQDLGIVVSVSLMARI